MKQLKFNHNLAKSILLQEKTSTIRINDDKNIVVGDVVEVIDKISIDEPTAWRIIGAVEVTRVELLHISDIDEKHIEGHEVYESREQFISAYRRYYGDFVSEDTPVKIIHFKFTKYEQPKNFIETNKEQGTPALRAEHVKMYADGGSRGNPGPSALGFVVLDDKDTVIYAYGKYLGITTNNQAEYQALVRGLEYCKNKVSSVDVYMDSLLVINQMKGIYKVRNRDLWSLYESAKILLDSFSNVTFTHVPRELNKLADRQVNIALDSVKNEEAIG